jgi:hypothetical protein
MEENVTYRETTTAVENRSDWIRPELKRLDAGSAESNETGANFDNSNPQRS